MNQPDVREQAHDLYRELESLHRQISEKVTPDQRSNSRSIGPLQDHVPGALHSCSNKVKRISELVEMLDSSHDSFPDFIKERCRWDFWRLTWDDGSVLFSDTWDGVEQVIKKNTGVPFVEPKRTVSDVLSAIRSSNAGVVIATSSGFVEFHYSEMTQGELNESFLREVIQSIRLSDHKLSGGEE